MGNWNISFTHANGSQASVTIPNFGGFGVGNSGTTPRVQCTCGFFHTFTGSQTSGVSALGSGNGSVAPPNDRPNESDEVEFGAGPSWEADITQPIEAEVAEPEEDCPTPDVKAY